MDFAAYREAERTGKGATETAARCYLLDGDFCVISAQTGEENAIVGAPFFDLFPANRILREEISAYARSYPRDVLLTLCARTPVLFIGTLFAQTGLVLAVLPKGTIKRTLSLPAAFHHVPAHVCVSASAQMRYKAHEEADFSAASRWLLAASAPFTCRQQADATPTSSVLAFCAEQLAALLHVPLSCDFSGLPAQSREAVDLAFAIGVMLAGLMAARRIAHANGVQLCAVKEGAPTLYLRFSRTDARDMLPEFAPLLRVAAARGAILDVVCPLDDPYLVEVRACFGVVELSAQGVRERHRFLEGKSPLLDLPASRAIPPSFPELSFD